MTDWIRKRYKRIDLEFLKRAIYVIFAVIVLILTLMICLNSPVQRHFNNLRKMMCGLGINGIIRRTENMRRLVRL